MEVFVAALTIFVLALFVGYEVITKVPPAAAHAADVGGERDLRDSRWSGRSSRRAPSSPC